MTVWWTCECEALNILSSKTCEACGKERHAKAKLTGPKLCPFDGAALDNGYCEKGQGYPNIGPCPFNCPFCGHDVGWSGECMGCFGCKTGNRYDWMFPVDGYYTHTPNGEPIGDGQHWVKQQGPRSAMPRKDSRKYRRIIEGKLGSLSLLGGEVVVSSKDRPLRSVRAARDTEEVFPPLLNEP